MAVPKKKTSKMKRDQRRSHHHFKSSHVVECPQCSEPKLHHRVCSECGFYKGSEVVTPKD